MSEEEKEIKRAYGRDRYKNMTEDEENRVKKYQRNYQAAKYLFFLYSIKMSGKTLKFDDFEVNKKEFHASKKPIGIHSVDINRKVISDKFKHSDNSVKYFIGYAEDDVIRPLSIVLPQMSGYIKYFQNDGNVI